MSLHKSGLILIFGRNLIKTNLAQYIVACICHYSYVKQAFWILQELTDHMIHDIRDIWGGKHMLRP